MILAEGRSTSTSSVRYSGGFSILNEHLAKAGPAPDAEVYFDRSSDRVNFGPQVQTPSNGAQAAEVPSKWSILSRFKSHMDTTPVTEVGNHFEQIRIFREFRTGLTSQARHGVSTAVLRSLRRCESGRGRRPGAHFLA